MADHDVEIVTVAGCPTAVSRGVAKSWEEFASRWKPMLDGVWAFLGQNDLRTDGHNIMVYRNDVPHLEFEVGVQVAQTFEPAGAVVPSSLPRGRAAQTIHRGNYAGLGEAHDAIARWCRANGHTPSGTRCEVYGDWDVDPANVQTAVYWLLVG
ncbi:MAG: GyrI-like domain-containing protein [Candidatus Dormibacteraeota bacterium]|nr:GyrI-like domain-containing protein [Candidatus Dormibacteraeota bacterium]